MLSTTAFITSGGRGGGGGGGGGGIQQEAIYPVVYSTGYIKQMVNFHRKEIGTC